MKKFLKQVRHYDEDGTFSAFVEAFKRLDEGKIDAAKGALAKGLIYFVAKGMLLEGPFNWVSHPENIYVEEVFLSDDGEVVGVVGEYRDEIKAVAKDEETARRIYEKYQISPYGEDMSVGNEYLFPEV